MKYPINISRPVVFHWYIIKLYMRLDMKMLSKQKWTSWIAYGYHLIQASALIFIGKKVHSYLQLSKICKNIKY